MREKSEFLAKQLDTAAAELLRELLSSPDGIAALQQQLQVSAADQSTRRLSDGSTAGGSSSGDEAKSSGSDKSDPLNQTRVERSGAGDSASYGISMDLAGGYSAGIDIGRTAGKQDNHITAYAVLREIFFDAIDGKPLVQASANLGKIINVFGFEEAEKDKIKKLFEDHTTTLREAGLDNIKEKTKELTRDLRRFHMVEQSAPTQMDLTGAFRSIGFGNPERVQSLIRETAPRYTDERISQIKGALRGYAREQTAKFLSGEISHLITTANDRKFAASVSSRDSDADFHSRNENSAMNSMRLFSEVCKFAANISNVDPSDPQAANKKAEIIEDFKSNIPEIIKIAKPNISDPGTINRNFREFLEEFFPKTPGERGRNPCVTDLSNVNRDWANAIIPALRDLQSPCHKKVAEKANLLFDFRFVEHADFEEQKRDFETLKQALPNHVISIFAAFGGLRSLPKECKEQIIGHFAEEVMQDPVKEFVETRGGGQKEKYTSFGQGWGSFKTGGRSKKSITKDDLSSGIKEQLTLSDDRYFYPKAAEARATAIDSESAQKTTAATSSVAARRTGSVTTGSGKTGGRS